MLRPETPHGCRLVFRTERAAGGIDSARRRFACVPRSSRTEAVTSHLIQRTSSFRAQGIFPYQRANARPRIFRKAGEGSILPSVYTTPSNDRRGGRKGWRNCDTYPGLGSKKGRPFRPSLSLTTNCNFLEREFGVQCNRSGVAAEGGLEVPKNTVREVISTYLLRSQCRGPWFQDQPLASRGITD
jgi:hypothetical protein